MIFVLSVLCLNGQTVDDVYTLSTSYYQGTAKSAAMGNAMGAVGQDFTAANINPAGLSLFRKPSMSFTPSINMASTNSDYRGNNAKDFRSKFSVNNFGFVGVSTNENSVCKHITWSLGMNRTNNFCNMTYASGDNFEHSLLDAYASELYYAGVTNDNQLYDYSQSYIYPLWETYLLDFDNGVAVPNVPLGNLYQHRSVNTWGGTNEWTFGMGFNFNDKVHLGFSINAPFTYYRRTATYGEDALEHGIQFKWWQQEENLSSRGWGIKAKFGVIVQPLQWLRLGAAVHTPSVSNITDTWETETFSDFGRVYSYRPNTYSFTYQLTTPARYNISAAFIFGNYGMVSADYEFVNYRHISLYSIDFNYSNLNHYIEDYYSPTSNIRLGTEWRYNNFCFRGGYAFYGSPFGFSNANGRTNMFSAGFGFTKGPVTWDFAYVYSLRMNKYDMYWPYTESTVNEAGNGNNTVKENNSLHSIVVSLKFRLY